jgi:hypothetical protein
MTQLRKATRQKAKIRLGLSAVSGGGKTFSALLIAKGLCGSWDKIAVIDTENGSADLYSHLGDYNVLSLNAPYSPERYIEAIQDCENAGMEVIVIDSIAHEWEGEGGVLNLCDTIGGGFQSAWKQMTPRHDKFKNAILASKCHIITTVRRKQEYILVEETNRQGKTVQKPVKAGLKEITREGWEYELTINMELDIKHQATASKDRTGLFMGIDPFIPSEKTGELIRQWCENGIDVENEINVACNKLSQCDTVDALKALRESLPDYVSNSDRFKIAGRERYNEITSPKKELTNG